MPEPKIRSVKNKLSELLPMDIVESKLLSDIIGKALIAYETGELAEFIKNQKIGKRQPKILDIIGNTVKNPEYIMPQITEKEDRFLPDVRLDYIHIARCTVILGDGEKYIKNIEHFEEFIDKYHGPQMMHYLILDNDSLGKIEENHKGTLQYLQNHQLVQVLTVEKMYQEIGGIQQECKQYSDAEKELVEKMTELDQRAYANDIVRSDFLRYAKLHGFSDAIFHDSDITFKMDKLAEFLKNKGGEDPKKCSTYQALCEDYPDITTPILTTTGDEDISTVTWSRRVQDMKFNWDTELARKTANKLSQKISDKKSFKTSM